MKKRRLNHAEIIRTGTGYVVIHHKQVGKGRPKEDGSLNAPDLFMFCTREELVSWLEESLENCE